MHQKCRNCKRSYEYILSHLKGFCKIAYTKEEIILLRKEARKITHRKAYLKRYSALDRHQRYVSSKNPHSNKQSSTMSMNLSDLDSHKRRGAAPLLGHSGSDGGIAADPDIDAEAAAAAFDEGFRKMIALIEKEIKRNSKKQKPQTH